jgi:predicted transcriptional regulator
MDREATKQIRENRRKEIQEKQARKTLTMLTITKRLAEKELVKQQRESFIATWSLLTMKEVGDKFHHNFKACL